MGKIKFGTDGWRAIIDQDFNPDNLTRVAEGMATWLQAAYDQPSVMIGYDCRRNGPAYSDLVARVMAAHGIQVFVANRFVSTPMVSLGVHKRQVKAGVVITASHNPPEYSGFKIKGDYGGPAYPSIIDAVEVRIPDAPSTYEESLESLMDRGLVQYFDMEALYLNHVRDTFDLDLIHSSGIKIGYDAMFGAGQRAFRKLLPHATLLHADYDITFQGTAPEPIERNLGEFQALIRSAGLDVGVATDGDADRIGLLDERGEFVDSHHIILLLIHYLHKVKGQSGKVVITFSVTPKVEKLCALYGLPIEVTKVGFKYICEIMLNEHVLVGGEESGGIAIAGHVPERDGIYIGLTIVEMMARSGKKLTELIDEIYGIVGAFSFQRNDLHLENAKKEDIVAGLIEGRWTNFGSYTIVRTEDLDGYKFHLGDDRWVMVRPSGTEPVLRIYAEAATRAEAEDILRATIATITA
jgi:phosphomannomutase